MPTICNFTTTINETDNIGSSRITINNNFSKLDTAACTLSTTLTRITTAIDTGALRGTPGLSGISFFAPVGTVTGFAGTSLVSNDWLLCNGTQYTSSSKPALFNAIGTKYNQAGETDPTFFRVPNLNGKLVVGTSDVTPVGTTGTILVPAGITNTLTYLGLQYYIKAN